MLSANASPRFLRKEHEVSELAQRYLNAADACHGAAKAAVLAYLNGETESAGSAHRDAMKLQVGVESFRETIHDRMFIGAFLPYFALYLQSIGLSAGRIAVLMSLADGASNAP